MELNTEEHRGIRIILSKIFQCVQCISVFSVLNFLREMNATDLKKI